VELRSGDVLVLFTDGVTEAMTPGGELFGEDRLRREIEQRRMDPAVMILRGIWEAIQAWQGGEQEDDATIVVVRSLPG
jgi:sigma-B regulation protein RsbU (phosphoserine phosphatase)